MHKQLGHCHRVLDILPNGEGVLCHKVMTSSGLGKIDGCQYTYFLAGIRAEYAARASG